MPIPPDNKWQCTKQNNLSLLATLCILGVLMQYRTEQRSVAHQECYFCQMFPFLAEMAHQSPYGTGVLFLPSCLNSTLPHVKCAVIGFKSVPVLACELNCVYPGSCT